MALHVKSMSLSEGRVREGKSESRHGLKTSQNQFYGLLGFQTYSVGVRH